MQRSVFNEDIAHRRKSNQSSMPFDFVFSISCSHGTYPCHTHNTHLYGELSYTANKLKPQILITIYHINYESSAVKITNKRLIDTRCAIICKYFAIFWWKNEQFWWVWWELKFFMCYLDRVIVEKRLMLLDVSATERWTQRMLTDAWKFGLASGLTSAFGFFEEAYAMRVLSHANTDTLAVKSVGQVCECKEAFHFHVRSNDCTE